jgi:ribosomal protein S16
MKLVIRLRPVHRGVYSILVQEERSAYSSPAISKLGTYTIVNGVTYMEVSLKNLSLWLDLGVPVANKRLLSFISSFYGRS